MTAYMRPTQHDLTHRFNHQLAYQPAVDQIPLDRWRGYRHPWHYENCHTYLMTLWRIAEAYAAGFLEPCGIAWIEATQLAVYFPPQTSEEVRQWISNHPCATALHPWDDGWVVILQHRST